MHHRDPGRSGAAGTGTDAEAPLVTVSVQDRAAILTLNRPDAGNLMNSAMLTRLRAEIAAAGADDEVDAVVLTGHDPAFCVGDDVEELASADAGVRRRINEAIFVSPRVWDAIGKPVIGAINGAAERGGLEIAMQCDFLIASDRATFRDIHVLGGVVPAWALSTTLPAAVGRAAALRMCLTGRPIDAPQALALGLVTEVVGHDRLLAAVRDVVAEISAGDPAAVRSLLETFRASGPLADERALGIELDAHAALLESTERFPDVLDVLKRAQAARSR